MYDIDEEEAYEDDIDGDEEKEELEEHDEEEKQQLEGSVISSVRPQQPNMMSLPSISMPNLTRLKKRYGQLSEDTVTVSAHGEHVVIEEYPDIGDDEFVVEEEEEEKQEEAERRETDEEEEQEQEDWDVVDGLNDEQTHSVHHHGDTLTVNQGEADDEFIIRGSIDETPGAHHDGETKGQ